MPERTRRTPGALAQGVSVLPRNRLEAVFHIEHHVARRPPEHCAVIANTTVVVLVEQIVDVEGRLQVAVDIIAANQSHQCVRLLLEFGAGVFDLVPILVARLKERRTLPVRIAAHGEFVPIALQAVVGCHLEQVLRLVGGHAPVSRIMGLGKGVAGHHLQVIHQFAVHFQLEAASRDAFLCSIGTTTARCATAGGYGEVVLLELEQRHAGI